MKIFIAVIALVLLACAPESPMLVGPVMPTGIFKEMSMSLEKGTSLNAGMICYKSKKVPFIRVWKNSECWLYIEIPDSGWVFHIFNLEDCPDEGVFD